VAVPEPPVIAPVEPIPPGTNIDGVIPAKPTVNVKPAGTIVTPANPIVVSQDNQESIFMLGNYNKLLVAIAGLVIAWLTQHYGNNSLTTDVVYVLTALGVYQSPNTPKSS
jgi:hypothetical protein